MSARLIRLYWKNGTSTLSKLRGDRIVLNIYWKCFVKVDNVPDESDLLERHQIERAEEEFGLLKKFENMEIWAGGPNEDQDGEAEAVKEQLLEPGNPQEQVPKVRNPDKEVQTSILSFSKKK